MSPGGGFIQRGLTIVQSSPRDWSNLGGINPPTDWINQGLRTSKAPRRHRRTSFRCSSLRYMIYTRVRKCVYCSLRCSYMYGLRPRLFLRKALEKLAARCESESVNFSRACMSQKAARSSRGAGARRGQPAGAALTSSSDADARQERRG
eukprot:7111197-Prymnesium_polylepis.2